MKKILILFGVLSLFTSCGNDLEKYNIDPKNPVEVDPTYLFTYGQYNIIKQFTDASYNANVDLFWANYATQTVYTEESNYDAANRDIGGTMWDNIYTEALAELKAAKDGLRKSNVSAAQLPEKNNKLALIKIMEVFAYQYLVDNFGNVPFTEAVDINNVTPKYDDDEFIYNAISDSLSDAISSLTVGKDVFGDNDLLYGGDISKWKKFGNSLQLKIGLRIADQNPTKAASLIQSAVSGGVFTSNDDNAILEYTGVQPYVNPMYTYFVVDKRNSDFVATTEFLSLLEGLSDPRVDVYYDDNFDPKVGGPYGAKGNVYANLTHLSPDIFQNSTYPTLLMSYSTVSFELAEAVQRGIITGDAITHYNNGISASFDYLGLTGSSSYIIAHPYNAANWRQSIGIQKYIALFPNGHEAWTEARRIGVPQLVPAAATGKENPRRMIYPVEEVLINTSNYNEAETAMGGDETTSKIFWDVN